MIGSSIVITALTVSLLVSGCDQVSNPIDEAESYAMKSCGIYLETSNTGETKEYVFPRSDNGLSFTDNIIDLEAMETRSRDRAQTAAQANRLDAYWNELADSKQEIYSFVRELVKAREAYAESLGWYGKDWPPGGSVPELVDKYRVIGDRALDFNDAAVFADMMCGSLEKTLNAD